MASSRELPSDCKLEELEKYKKTLQRLSEPIISNNGRDYEYIDTDVKYGKKKFYVEVLDYEFVAAAVTSVKSYNSNERNEVTCTGTVDENLINVENVNMKKTIGKGNCTKAVAYLIKTLMLEAKKRGSCNSFPHEGTVYIASKNGCSAANCYIKAFMLNGFDYDKEELKKLVKKIEVKNGNVNYKLNFKNKKQEQEQKRITTTTRKRKRELLHEELPLNAQRIIQLKF